MPVIRMEIKKSGPVSYLSHLDYVEALQRALRRGGIDVTYSQGFNPHMKVSFGAALAVGIESIGEVVDVEVNSFNFDREFEEKMNSVLPDGMTLTQYMFYEDKPISLSKILGAGSYLATWDCNESGSVEELQLILNELKTYELLEIDVVSPKKTKTFNLIAELIKWPKLIKIDQEVQLEFWLRLSTQGSLKATSFINYLSTKGFPKLSKTRVVRNGLWQQSQEEWITPFHFKEENK